MLKDVKQFYVVWLLLAVAAGWQLGSLPGLMGDESSEGENVYELLGRESITVTGERSYIGPVIDYVRVPFVAWLGYTPLALRAVMWLAAVASVWLLWRSLEPEFGATASLWGLVLFVFSPIFLLFSRLGWAISLFPLSLAGLLVLAKWQSAYRWLVWGVVAGLSLANHILFLPTLAGLVAFLMIEGGRERWRWLRAGQWRRLLSEGLLLLVGFWAGFGMQFAVLQLQTDDQGDPEAVAGMLSERWQLWKTASPLYVSGSSYIARYTGVELSSAVQISVSVVIQLGILAGCWVWRRKVLWWAGLVALCVQMGVLMVMIDRFTLRYFMMPVLLVWLLSGLGWGGVLSRLRGREGLIRWGAVAVAGLLLLWMVVAVVIPFNRTGGSVADFSLGDRTNSAAALVDVRPLVACLRGQGAVWSESVHIWNRLQYLSHEYGELVVVPEKQKSLAVWEVHYRGENQPVGSEPGDLCPELSHFRVVSRGR